MAKAVYHVIMKYLNTIEAESYEEAEERTEEMIRDGDIVPIEIETEIAEHIDPREEDDKYNYEYAGLKFEFKQDVIAALIEEEEICSFYAWLDDNYSASEVYENPFEDLTDQYEDYKETMLIWFIQAGVVKELK